jgi:hypothetical protein
MFHMMNEARIGVGRAATAMGYAAFRYALDYARQRKQGRLPGEKDPKRPPVAIIEHADVRRMLLTAKCSAEGSLALILECSRLVDEQQTAEDAAARERATLLLEVLTPIAKTWPSVYCQEGISACMQTMGGYGYAREYDVEQLYRDNRLNQIHEGTNGIQALDLLGRKVTQQKGAAYAALVTRMAESAKEAAAADPSLAPLAAALGRSVEQLSGVTKHLVGVMMTDPTRGLANATAYLELTSRVVFAWLWLRQATVASKALAAGATGTDVEFYQGKIHAARHYFGVELPKSLGDIDVLMRNDATALEMQDAWF